MVQLVSELSSKMPTGARFETRLKEDLRVDDRIVAPAGTAVYVRMRVRECVSA